MKQFYKILASLMLVCLLGVSNQVEVFAGKPGTNSRFITSSKVEHSSATITWINGNGNGRIVVLYTDAVSRTDADGKINDGELYDANSDFSATGSQVLINDGSKRAVVVYKGTGSTRTVNVSGLSASTKYWVRAYEYKNDGGIDPEYLETVPTGNPVHFTTKNNPAPTKPTNLIADEITDKTAMANWTIGTNTDGFYMDLYNNDSGQYEWEGVDIGMPNPNLELFIDGLAASTSYAFRLNAYDNDGQTSGYTSNSNFETLADVTAPEMISGEFVSEYRFKIYFTEPIVKEGNVESKFSLLYVDNFGDEVDADITGFNVDVNDNTIAICTTAVDISNVANGYDIEIKYVNGVSDRVEDLVGNPMTSPSSTLIKDWKAPRVASIKRVISNGSTGFTTNGATYGTNDSYIYLKVTFDERVKAADANFILSVDDVNDNSFDGKILDVNYENDQDGFTNEFVVEMLTGEDNDCDGYSVYVSDNDGNNIIRDASGNVFGTNEVLGTEEGFKVDRIAPNSDKNGTLNPAIATQEAFEAQAVQLGTTYELSTGAYDQIKDIYNESNLNGTDANDLVLIRTNVEFGDCSLDGGNIKLKYYVENTVMEEFEFVQGINVAIDNDLLSIGYADLVFDISQFLNPEMYEGKKVSLNVVTTDIGGNETETTVFFGFFSNATDLLLYDVIAPDPMYDLIKDVDVENPISTIVSNPSAFDGINEIGAYNTVNPNEKNYNYVNLDHNAITTALGPLDPNDNTLLGGFIELKAKVIGDAEWTNVDGYYDQYLSSNIDELFENGINNYSLDTKYMYVRFQNNETADNFTGLLNAIGAEHGDKITFQVCVTDFAENTTCYNTESSLELDLVRPNPNDINIVGLIVGNPDLNGFDAYSLIVDNHPAREYFNTYAQENDKTLYFGYGIKGNSNDNSLVGGKVYLEYRVSPYFAETITGQIQDNWIKLAYTDGEMNDVLLDLNIAVNLYELESNTNLYEELHTSSEINGDVYEFRIIPIDRAGNHTSSEDRMATLPSTIETIVLDNVAPKVVKAYSSDLKQFYLQEFAYDCYGDQNDMDNRYYFNKNTGTVGGSNDVIGTSFELLPDITMNVPGNGVKSILQYLDGSSWSQLGPDNIYSSIDLGTMNDNFGVPNNGDFFVVTDWVSRQDITDKWNSYSEGANLTNMSDLRIQVELTDVAGNTVTIVPTPTADGNPFNSNDAFVFRYDRSSPLISNIAFLNPETCLSLDDHATLNFDIEGYDNYTKVISTNTSINGVNHDNDCDDMNNINPNFVCYENELDANLGANSSLIYTLGKDDTYRSDEDVVPFSIQVIDVAGNESEIETNENNDFTAEMTPIIDTRNYTGFINSAEAFDANNNKTNFLFGNEAGRNIINKNTDYIKITLPSNIPDYVSKIRVFFVVDNNIQSTTTNNLRTDDFKDYYSFNITSQDEYLTIPLSTFENLPDGQDGNGPSFIWSDATENVYLKVGYKFEVDACGFPQTLCEQNYITSFPIDRVAPRMVTYESLQADAQDCNNDYEGFTNNFSVGTYSINSLASDFGYNIFTGPVVFKVTAMDNNNIGGTISNLSFDVLGSEVSYTNANTAGYNVLFSEKLYPSNSQYYTEEFPIFANDFLSLTTNQTAADNELNNGINSYHSYALLKSNTLPCGNKSYQSITFFAEGIVGNGDFEMTLDKDELVDAAGNKLVDLNGDAYLDDISITYGDINYPFTLDNIAPTVSNLKVYSDVDRQNQISETCITTNEQNTLYFDFELNEYNSLRYADAINTDYTIDFENSSVDPVTPVADNVSVLIGIRDLSNNNLLGVLKTTVQNENYTGDNNDYSLYYVNAEYNFENAVADVDYKLFNGLTLNDLDENVTFSLGFSSEEEMSIGSLFVADNYAQDIASNISSDIDTETLTGITIDNKAPVLDMLLANVIDNSGTIPVAQQNSCFTATGTGASVLVLSVSINEKDGQFCGETDHFLTASNWNVKIGNETLSSSDYRIDNNIYCAGCITDNPNVKTYYVTIDLKNLTGDYSFDDEGTNGQYDYSIEVSDVKGNKGISENPLYQDNTGITNNPLYQVNIDNTAPVLSNLVGPEGCYTNGDNFTFKVNVQDLSIAEACGSDYVNESNWTVVIGAGIDAIEYNSDNFAVLNKGNGEFEFTVTIPTDTYSANSEEQIYVAFRDALGNEGSYISTTENYVKIVAEPYEVSLSSDDAEVCVDEESFILEYTTNFTPTTSTVKVGNTPLTANEDYVLDPQNGTITINVDAVSNGDMIKLTLGSDCDDVTSNELEVIVNPTPTAPVVTENDEDNILCSNSSITFVADENNNSGFTYSWEIKVGTGNWVALSSVLGNSHYQTEGNTLTITNHANIILSNANTNYTVRATKTNEVTLCDEIGVYDGAITVKAPVSVTSISKTTTGTNAYFRNTTGNKYKVNTINGGNNLTYTWSVVGTTASDLNWTMSNTNTSEVSINYAINAKPGTLRVTIKDECDIEIQYDYEVEMLYTGSTAIRFTSIGTKSFTVSWTNGTSDGKILVGVQGSATSGLIDKELNSTLSTELNNNFNSLSASGDWSATTNTLSSNFLRSSGTANVNYKLLQNLNNNTATTFNVTNLTTKVQYTVRLFDYLLDNSNNRIYGKSTQSTQRTNKEGSEGDSDNLVATVNSISSISPNPAKDEINFNLDMANSGNVTIEIFTAEGRKVMTFTEDQYLNAGENLFKIPLKDFAAGSYMIMFNFGDSFMFDNFIVMP